MPSVWQLTARRSEHYYRKIRNHGAVRDEHHGNGIASTRDRVIFRHPVALDVSIDAQAAQIILLTLAIEPLPD